MTSEALVNELVNNYVHQKQKLLLEANHRGSLDIQRLQDLIRPRMEKLASIIDSWYIDPVIILEALFAWAKYNNHPDGPMPNMLGSVKYITKAVGYYLQIPYEVVAEKKCQTLFLRRRDDAYEQVKRELSRAGVSDLASATSYPIEFRYLMGVERLDATAAFYMAQELLELMRSDLRVSRWLESRGVKYEAVAAQFNRKRKAIKSR